MAYDRPAGAHVYDLQNAREFEAFVRDQLGQWLIDRTDSSTDLDFFVPGFYLDVKEKRQPLGGRWPAVPGYGLEDCVVLDELGVRKCLEHFPHSYLLIRDKPLDRLFLASATELACIERVRVNRHNSRGHRKGKLIYPLPMFRPLGEVVHIYEHVMDDILSMPWRVSECVGHDDIGEV